MSVRWLLALATLVLVGCATVDPREDIRIEAEVKARLVAQRDGNFNPRTSARGPRRWPAT